MQPAPHDRSNGVTPIGPKPSASVVIVDPETARRWLETNEVNRSIRDKKVNQYVRDMEAGRWESTGEPIKFAKNGRLLDGQHRLWAIVMSEVTLPLFVVRGLDDIAQSYMDTGAARTAKDALSLEGEKYSGNLAATARLAITLDAEERGIKLNNAVSHAEIFDWIEENPQAREAVAAWYGFKNQIGVPSSVLGYCVHQFAQVDPQACDEFFHGLATHENLPPRSPLLALSTRLTHVKSRRIHVSNREYVLLVFRTWNAWRTNRPAKQIKLPRADEEIPRPL